MHADLPPRSPRHSRHSRPVRSWAAGALLGLSVAAGAQGVATPPAPAFRLGPGDVLSVSVWKQPTLSLQLPVAPDGTLRYPLAGQLDVQGRTLVEVEAALSARLGEQIREALVTVSLVQVHSYRVYVLGEVLRPGELILRGPVGVLQALAMANGFTPFAKRDKVLVVRRRLGVETRENFDYNAYVRGEAAVLADLEPGDTVIVQ